MNALVGKVHYSVPDYRDLRELLRAISTQYAEAPAFSYRPKPRQEALYIPYRQVWEEVQALGTGMLELGLAAVGDPIAILGENSYAWVLAQASTISGLGLAVPLDRQLAPEEVVRLINRARAKVFFCDPQSRKVLEAVKAGCPTVGTFIYLHQPQLPAQNYEDARDFSISAILRAGREALSRGVTSFTELPIDPDAPASLYFTSGTTSASKGVLLSHRNILENGTNGLRILHIPAGSRCLSVLPLHHTFENTVGLYAMWIIHNCVCFNDGLRYFSYNLKEWKIQGILAVPLLLEALYKQLQQGIQKQGKAKLVRRMRKLGRILRKCGLDLRRQFFKKILAELGGEFQFIIAGAAALAPEISIFFEDIGISCYLGYGLTEAGPMVAANTQSVFVPGSVGEPLAHLELRIDGGDETAPANQTGEVLVRSSSVMLGYYEDPEATREAIDEEGWLHTGDIGYIDESGVIFLTGRKKSMIVLNNGKKVFPEELEYLLTQEPGVEAAFVFGDTDHRGNVQCCTSLQINPEKIPPKEDGKKRSDEEIADWIENIIRRINEKIPSYKAIKYFIWNEEGMIMTTTLKVRRALEENRIRSYLSALGQTMREAHRSHMGAPKADTKVDTKPDVKVDAMPTPPAEPEPAPASAPHPEQESSENEPKV